MPGDVVMARFRWSQDGDGAQGRKIRPCMVLKVSSGLDSVILLPLSTKEAFDARDGIEIRPSERAAAGLSGHRRSWVKPGEVNRIDLPSAAIVPNVTPDGRLAWRRGRVADEVLHQAQAEVARRIHDKTLKGAHIKTPGSLRMRLAGARRAADTARAGDAPISPPHDRAARVRHAAQRLCKTRQAESVGAPCPHPAQDRSR